MWGLIFPPLMHKAFVRLGKAQAHFPPPQIPPELPIFHLGITAEFLKEREHQALQGCRDHSFSPSLHFLHIQVNILNIRTDLLLPSSYPFPEQRPSHKKQNKLIFLKPGSSGIHIPSFLSIFFLSPSYFSWILLYYFQQSLHSPVLFFQLDLILADLCFCGILSFLHKEVNTGAEGWLCLAQGKEQSSPETLGSLL